MCQQKSTRPRWHTNGVTLSRNEAARLQIEADGDLPAGPLNMLAEASLYLAIDLIGLFGLRLGRLFVAHRGFELANAAA
jgi:hypothetical protein